MRFPILLMLCASLSAAEPVTVRQALEEVRLEGAAVVAVEQLRDALAGDIRLRRLARQGAAPAAIADTAASLLEDGYRASGFANVRVVVVGARLVIGEGRQRRWSGLEVEAPSPSARELAVDILCRPTQRETGLPARPGEVVGGLGLQDPVWQQGEPASFHHDFPALVQRRIQNGWAAAGLTRPEVEVVVEKSGAQDARCTVRIAQPPSPPLLGVAVEGASANPPARILAWLDRQAGVKTGTPADPGLLAIACTRLLETGRFMGATVRIAEGRAVFTVREHPLLPLLDAELSPWQRRWLDLGERLRELYRSGPGLALSGRMLDGRVSARIRLSSRAIGGAVNCPGRDLEVLILPEQAVLLRTPGLPIVGTLAGGPTGHFGIGPPDEPDRTLTLSLQAGFRTGRGEPPTWACSPAALLATAGRTWHEDPARPGCWREFAEDGALRSVVRWDADGRWLGWELVMSPEFTLEIAAAVEPPDHAALPVGPGAELWRSLLREPSAWLGAYRGQTWADLPLGLAAGICVPAAVLWPSTPTPTPTPTWPVAFALPAPTPSAPSLAQFGGMLALLAEHLGTQLGATAWPTALCSGFAAGLEGDQQGFVTVMSWLQRPDAMGPLGRIVQAHAFASLGLQPAAGEVARLGLAVCTAEWAWADLRTCVGSDALLLRWVQAIEQVEDVARLAPPGQRAAIVRDLQAIQGAAATQRQALLSAAFARWWDGGLGEVVRAELTRFIRP